ncbi:MAG TPA: Calx-beta domain-containing protein, partial [Candidatus Binataceae bacterium]|nr:Calx-beta domain-containing protein [Candidatus Binataceae bacterium]
MAKNRRLVPGPVRLWPIALLLFSLTISLSAWGDATTVAISGANVTVTGSASTTLNFPITRGSDTSYDAFVQYQTQDGTAVAGTDYARTTGSLVIPAGATSATIPVRIAGVSSNPATNPKTFQMLLLGGGGAGRGFTSSFATQQSFGTNTTPYGVAIADLNGDGKPDLIVANEGTSTVSVLLNTTSPG